MDPRITFNLTGHQTGSQMVVISDATWTKLSPEQQEALSTAVAETQAENRTCIEEAEQQILEDWKSSGEIEVVEDVDVETFRRQANDYFSRTLTGDQLELFEAIRASAP